MSVLAANEIIEVQSLYVAILNRSNHHQKYLCNKYIVKLNHKQLICSAAVCSAFRNVYPKRFSVIKV